MNLEEFKEEFNGFASNAIPFLFLIDFEMKKPFLCRLANVPGENILYDVNGKTNFKKEKSSRGLTTFNRIPVRFEEYLEAYSAVMHHINRGDTYLVNLTFPTSLELNLSLDELFHISPAPYRLYFKDEFVVFSPECFVKISEDHIFSYPMKGTLDASLPGAEEELLQSEKELYEHNTIVDLIRNDLSISAEEVEVTKFRYLDRIKTNQGDLLQVSSEIRGRLHKNYRRNLADIILKMLPAGSVSGAPKHKTVEIIRNAEKSERGYYTGIFGIYDGISLDSAVNIRYIERNGNGLQFRSGGGITALSNAEAEYNEMLEKVYVPFAGND